MDLFRLDGRTAIVTGAAGGLGRGIALALGERGAKIAVCDLKEEALSETMAALKERGIPAMALACDVSDPCSFGEVMRRTEETLGFADILVNNAGITRMQDFFAVNVGDFKSIYEINVFGLFRCTQMFAEALREKKRGGHVVNIASNGAKKTYADQVHYCSSKAAVVNMTQCMAECLAPYDINVNSVCPGAVDTAMLRACMVATEEQTNGAVTVADCEKTWGPAQLGFRLIEPEEVGRIVAFLCSPAGAMIRGQALNVDAGTTRY